MGISGILLREAAHDLRVQVGKVRQQRTIELAKYPRRDQGVEVRARGKDDIVSGVPGQQARRERFNRVEDVIVDGNAVSGLELPHDRRVDVVVPVVDIENPLLGRSSGRLPAARQQQQREQRDTSARCCHSGSGTTAGLR